MRHDAGKRNRGWKAARGVPISRSMNYVLAILLPPLSIALTGRVILAVTVFVVWIFAILFSGGLGHPAFVILAWFLIHQARADRRHRELMRAERYRDE